MMNDNPYQAPEAPELPPDTEMEPFDEIVGRINIIIACFGIVGTVVLLALVTIAGIQS